MSLMLLSQASLLAKSPLIGADSSPRVSISGDGTVITTSSTDNTVFNIYKSTGSGWNRVVVDWVGYSGGIKNILINHAGDKILAEYFLPSGAGGSYRITLFSFDHTTGNVVKGVEYNSSDTVDMSAQDINNNGFVFKTTSDITYVPFSGTASSLTGFGTDISKLWFQTITSSSLYWYKKGTASVGATIGSITSVTTSPSSSTYAVTLPLNAGFKYGSCRYEGSGLPMFAIVYDNSVSIITVAGAVRNLTLFDVPVPSQTGRRGVYLSKDAKRLLVTSSDTITSKFYLTIFSMNSSGEYALIGTQEIGSDLFFSVSASSDLGKIATRPSSGATGTSVYSL
jgi:hypothetical protein